MAPMEHPPVPPGVLDLAIRRWGAVVELALAGDLDSATAGRLGEAITWLRHSTHDAEIVVVDTAKVVFVSAAGYRALHAALAAWDDRPRTRVVSVEGHAVARIEAAVVALSAPREGRPARAHRVRRAPSSPARPHGRSPVVVAGRDGAPRR